MTELIFILSHKDAMRAYKAFQLLVSEDKSD
jgi:hypothetical protein